MRKSQAAVRGIEGRKLLGAVTNDGDSQCFQKFKGLGQVEERLHSLTGDHKGRAAEGRQVGGNIEAVGKLAMDSSNSPGGENSNLDPTGEPERGGHRRAAPFPVADYLRQVSQVDFEAVIPLGQRADLLVREADPDFSRHHSNYSRNGPGTVYDFLQLAHGF